MIHLYGIPNCDTVKKALDRLKKHHVEFIFHNFKSEGITMAKLKAWSIALGMDVLLNKKSATWRGLTLEEQQAAGTDQGALSLMQHKTSVIKRPVIEWANGTITVGYHEESFLENL